MSAPEERPFAAETGQLLHLVIHSLYSQPDIFLRELISNGADALDKLRFEALSRPELLEGGAELAIDVECDAAARTVTVRDNGIGMSRDELAQNLGTIARSGTAEFARRLKDQQQDAGSLIGQFGVGFYAAFIVAQRVEVRSRHADLPAAQGARFESDGESGFRVETIEHAPRGTEVVLHLKPDTDEYLEPQRLEAIIHKYSEHLPFAVRLRDGAEGWRTVNRAQALWTRPRSELKPEDYAEFYREISFDFAPPLAHLHARIEGGNHAYTALLYIPGSEPFDLWQRERRSGVRLYVRRVFILEDTERLLPGWLRFVRGVVDSDDLPLNVSREMLQGSRAVDAIRAGCTRRVLDQIEALAKDTPEQYQRFWGLFGRVLKEGVVEDPAHRERLIRLLRFASTRTPEQTLSLDDYVARMAPAQDTIWYLTADTLAAAQGSPHLEALRARDIEVLLLTDRIDPWLAPALGSYGGKTLRAVTEGELPAQGEPPAGDAESKPQDDSALCERVRELLGERVSAVRPSHRLKGSPACLVTPPGGIPPSVARTLRAAGQNVPEAPRVLELNLEHPLVRRVAEAGDTDRAQDWAALLYEGALVAEGELPADAPAFIARVHRLLA